jgi:sugar lactone lactonase YvrE
VIKTTVCALSLFLAQGAWSQSANLQSPITGVISADAKVEIVRGGYHRLEGPVPTPEGGLFFSDVDENRTYLLNPDGNISAWREDTQGANGLYLSPNRNLSRMSNSVTVAGASLIWSESTGGFEPHRCRRG